ncbi:hypothetical protein GQ457_16G030200 [Hibiscus cannabinus]
MHTLLPKLILSALTGIDYRVAGIFIVLVTTGNNNAGGDWLSTRALACRQGINPSLNLSM